MSRIEQWSFGIILGAVLPITGLLAGWWGSYSYLSITWVIVFAAAGMAAGLVVDGFYLKKWIAKAYDIDLRVWAAIYLFYSVCLFGFFMGVPVFNLALAVPSGLFIGRKAAVKHMDAASGQRLISSTRWFTTGVLVLICAASAWFALRSPSTPADLEGMLRLPFEVTLPMIWGLIALGGALLLAVHWLLFTKCARFTRGWEGGKKF